jgi:murein L,D-transpeptidase YcbB/YkuD
MFTLYSCGSATSNLPEELAHDEDGINQEVKESINDMLKAVDSGKVLKMGEVELSHSEAVMSFYRQHNYLPVWSDTGSFRNYGVELFAYLDTCIRDGLVADRYHYTELKNRRTSCKKEADASNWAEADILMTDAFMHILSDLKLGRIVPDSVHWKSNPKKIDSFYVPALVAVKKGGQLSPILLKQHPVLKEYVQLRNGVKRFVDSMDTRSFTFVSFPYSKGDAEDSLQFVNSFVKRLSEEAIGQYDKKALPDSLSLAEYVKAYQKKKGIKTDGKITSSLIRKINLTDAMRLKRIMVTLDRYKQMDQSLPDRYLVVNLPAFYLKVYDQDTLALDSKIICGTPANKTPLLKSEINEMVTYPTWTVPSGIIKKEMLPGLKRSSSYLSRRGLALYNSSGQRISASSINWSKYSTGIPFRVRQASGDNNALGVMKFNFENPFSVYLHDTNKRGLFDREYRALSHGCVRVQNWKGLSEYLVRADSINQSSSKPLAYNLDSVNQWLGAKKHKKLPVNYKLPIFIQYFSCEAKGGKIIFHDDIYDDDKQLLQTYSSRF